MKVEALLVLLCSSAALAHFKQGSNFCDDEKERFDKCKPLVSHHGCRCDDSCEESGSWEISGSGNCTESHESDSHEIEESGSGSCWEQDDLCFILQIFWEFSCSLDADLQIIFQEWINITQITIVENIQLTEYEIIVKIYYSLQILCEKHIKIKKAIQFLFIGDWGYVCDLEGLVLDIQTTTTIISIEEVITIIEGSCPLFDSLHECGHKGTSSQQTEIENLISELTIIIEQSISFQLKLVLIFEKCQQYFINFPDLKALIYSGEIKEFGVLGSFIDICAVYWRIENFEIAIGGSVSNCKFIQSMVSWYSNTSNGFSDSQRSDIKGFSDKCSNYFMTETDVMLRMKFVYEQLYQFFILEEWTLKIIYVLEIEEFGSCYELICAYVYCQNHGVGQGEFTTETTKTSKSTPTSTSTSTPTSTSTTTPTSTSSTTHPTTTSTTTPSTSTSTTTTTTTSTTTLHGNCATVTTCNTVVNNITLLLTAINNDQKNSYWSDSMKAVFEGYKRRIWVISTNSSSSCTPASRFNSIKTVLLNFTSDTSFKAIVMAIFIQTWGTIQQYCNCSM